MKKTYSYAGVVLGMTMLCSCNDWLREEAPGSQNFNDFFTGGAVAVQTVNACYAPLAWEYNNTYFSEWMFGDIASDDALKGGQNLADGADAYDIDNFKVNANNTICLDYYRAKYQGIARCNLALREVPEVEPDQDMTEERQEALIGEAYFLRGLYYFQLVRVFGGVPLVDFVIDSSDKWQQPRATSEEVYAHIVSDLKEAEKMLWDKKQYPAADLGRATRGAAQALLCKVYMYMHDYSNAYEWGNKFRQTQYGSQYQLCDKYADNFTLAGENGPESVLEIQYMADPTSDYGEGFGFTRGTFTTILTRPRMSSLGATKGWGWDHPTQDLYDAFEPGDPRREATVGVPDAASAMEVEVNYLGSPYYNRKTAYEEDGVFPALDHDSRSPLNYKLIRTSDILLLYAEAAVETGHPEDAKWALEEVRGRARKSAASQDVLPKFPNYGYADTTDGLRQAIRHERRVELGMEGHRWFDLVRWGIAAQVMDKSTGSYASHESEEVKAEMAAFIPGKSELFPIPAEEINLNPMTQNPGY